MFATVTMLAALSLAPGQSGELQLENVRAVYGDLGSERKDSKILPGDRYVVAFDIVNIKFDAQGKASYSMAMEIVDAKGKSQFKQDPAEQVTYNTLGGARVPAQAHVTVGLDMAAGEYTVNVIVTDLAAKKNVKLSRKFEVLPRDFGMVRLQLTTVGEGNAAVAMPPFGTVGQIYLVNFFCVSFDRDKGTGQPNLAVEMRVVDEAGKATLEKAITGEVKDGVPEKAAVLPMQFLLNLNRAGKFTVELKATDLVSKKTAKLSFPLTVIEPK